MLAPMAERWQIDRLVDDVANVGRRGLPREQFFAEVGARVRRVVDADAMCWHTLDPETRLLTSDAPRELVDSGVFTLDTIAGAGARIVASEYLVPDVNTFAGLAGRRTPVGILSRTTAGRPERSARSRVRSTSGRCRPGCGACSTPMRCAGTRSTPRRGC